MPFFFDRERRLRCEAAQAQDCVASAPDEALRQKYLARARLAVSRMPQSTAEALLLTLG